MRIAVVIVAEEEEDSPKPSSVSEDGCDWPWGWATVTLKVTVGPLSSEAYLGECSSKDLQAFLRGGYPASMVRECLNDISRQSDLLLTFLGVEPVPFPDLRDVIAQHLKAEPMRVMPGVEMWMWDSEFHHQGEWKAATQEQRENRVDRIDQETGGGECIQKHS